MNTQQPHNSALRLTPADIRWLENNTPYNTLFDDIYFSPEDGIAESEYVFLQGNKLAERWSQASLVAQLKGRFCIGEIGFGTGLNFLLASRLWVALAQNKNHLHYISTEKHPLTKSDLQRALQAFPELQRYSSELIEQYPPLVTGYHRLEFQAANISLHLLFGDATEQLNMLRDTDRQSSAKNGVNAWFLDGFAPAKNSELWQADIMKAIRSLSAANASFSTFSVAAAVKHSATEAGFKLQKQAGFGRKREMLVGHLGTHAINKHAKPHTSAIYHRSRLFPAASWYTNQPAQPQAAEGISNISVAIIGAGIAACTSALALSKRGFKVTVFEEHDQVAAGASGNSQAVLYSRLSPHRSLTNDFALHSYLYASRFYKHFGSQERPHPPCGVLQLLDNASRGNAEKLVRELNEPSVLQVLDQSRASQTAGIALSSDALYFPQGHVFNMPELCRKLLKAANVTVHLNQAINAIQLERSDQQHRWQLIGGNGLGSFDNVVVCSGYAASQFEQLSWLPIRPVRGQLTYLPSTSASESLQCVVCNTRYITPTQHGQHSIGSSFVHDACNTELSLSEQRENLQALPSLAPSFAPKLNSKLQLTGRAAIRCVSPDYLPLVGPIPKRMPFEAQFAALKNDSRLPLDIRPEYLPGLYVNTALGSSGLSFAPLCAEVLASQLNNEFSPLPAPLRHGLLPARFIIRNITRRRSI